MIGDGGWDKGRSGDGNMSGDRGCEWVSVEIGSISWWGFGGYRGGGYD
jgi:hypothetical protein